MPKLTYYVQGDWNGCCDECGLGFKFSQLSKRWDNAWVCRQCWEPRQPQDFLRSVKDDPSVPVARPRINLPTGLEFASDAGNTLSWSNSTGAVILWGS